MSRSGIIQFLDKDAPIKRCPGDDDDAMQQEWSVSTKKSLRDAGPEVLQTILSHAKAASLFGILDADGHSPLHMACFCTDVGADSVRLLIEHAPKEALLQTNRPHRWSILHYAVQRPCDEAASCVKAVLEALAPDVRERLLHARSLKGLCPLAYAVKVRHAAAVSELLRHGVDPAKVDVYLQLSLNLSLLDLAVTPLDECPAPFLSVAPDARGVLFDMDEDDALDALAEDDVSAGIIETLLDAGLEPPPTSLHAAAGRRGFTKVLELLLRRAPDRVNDDADLIRTPPLSFAIRAASVEGVRMLLEAGANPLALCRGLFGLRTTQTPTALAAACAKRAAGETKEHLRRICGLLLQAVIVQRRGAEVAQPEVAQPEVAQPEVAQPEVAQLEVAQPASRATCSHCGFVYDGQDVPIDGDAEGRVRGKPMKCSGCKRVKYCSEVCQKTAWDGGHKGECKALRQWQRESREAQ
jgi:ankyrin repeat protein/ferredoxin